MTYAAVSAGGRTQPEATTHMERETAIIGKSVVIKGELDGSEDLTVEGYVEGKIELREHTLTIGASGRIKAQVFAKCVVVLGELVGNIDASDRVDIRENGSVDGDIVAPRIGIAEGAHFRGSVDMLRKGQISAKPLAGGASAVPESKSGAASAPVVPVVPPRVGL
jgi:cytoskeletal protein CcmA (bactofilin family)